MYSLPKDFPLPEMGMLHFASKKYFGSGANERDMAKFGVFALAELGEISEGK